MRSGRFLSLFFLHSACLLALFAEASEPARQPERIILNLTAEPATSMAVTWCTEVELGEPVVEWAVAAEGTEFVKLAQRLPARMERWAEPVGAPAYHYSAVLTGLKPGTRYCYRVGAGLQLSEWNQFTTAEASAKPFSFVWLGDPQDEITEHCSRVFREAYRTAPKAAFWLFTGDICGDPLDSQWAEFFGGMGFIARMVPSIMTPGNHDTAYLLKEGKPDMYRPTYARRDPARVGQVWLSNLTLPENGVAGLGETNYHLDYQGLRVIMINSNTRLAEQAAWLEPLLASNPATWTVVAFHHPLYNGGAKRDNRQTRDAFLPLFDKYKVDLVLTGHDHVYMRSHPLREGRVAAAGEKGTVYLVSASGPKFYECNTPYPELMARTASGKQLFQVIEVGADRLSVRTHSADGVLFDECVIRK